MKDKFFFMLALIVVLFISLTTYERFLCNILELDSPNELTSTNILFLPVYSIIVSVPVGILFIFIKLLYKEYK